MVVLYDGRETISIEQVNTVIKEKVGGVSATQVQKLAKISLNESGKIDTVKLKDTAALKP
ncbi:MAG: hypothetical protein GQ535_17580 [Rhodobacteraceae bacterium]|nr:hypothetical protein [Paracoccaceae bacterium]